MQKGQSLTELKNIVIGKIIDDVELVKALVVDNESFLTATPTEEQNAILQSPTKLIRTQIMPYRNTTAVTNVAKPYITSAWTDFRKVSNVYKNGKVTFFILVPNSLEKTDYGIRYDFIADRLDNILGVGSNIGEFEFLERGDLPVDSNNLGHYISFKIVDFYGV
jgi:hypothetical protein